MSQADDNRFVQEHTPFVRAIAHKLAGQLEMVNEIDEFVAFGFHGLVEARARFDPTRGVQFNTFAYYRIRGAIVDGVRKMAYLPRRVHERLRAAEATDAVTEEVASTRGAHPEVRTNVEGNVKALDDALSKITAAFVLSALGQDQDTRPGELPDHRLLATEQRARVEQAVSALGEREQALVRGFYFEGKAFEEVAKALGISKSWASRLHTKALGELREALA